MKHFKVSLFLVAVVVVAAFAQTEDDEWQTFKREHKRKAMDAREEALRKANFRRANRRIKNHNAKRGGFKMALNEFSDWTVEEKKALTGKTASTVLPPVEDVAITTRETLPITLDWRSDDCMPAIKNQGSCGSCWAFSSIASLEFLVCKSGQSTTLSEQQLVDCTCNGCNGGDYYPAWQYLSTIPGSVAGSGYTYTGTEATCKTPKTALVQPLSWNRIQYNVTSIMSALKTYGVLAVAMDVQDSFMSYSSGVYEGTDCKSDYWSLNHAMNLVGYGKDYATGLDFWVVRNSWGANWGENGYIKVRKGTNECGLETDVGFVRTNLDVAL